MGVKIEASSDESQEENVDESQMRVEDIVAEMRQLQRALPVRPASEQVEAARAAIARADSLLVSRLEELFGHPRPAAVPTSVFRAFQEMREDVLRAQVQEQKRPWLAVLELEDRHRHYDSLIRRVQAALRTPTRPFGIVAKDSSVIESHGDGLRKLLNEELVDEAREDRNQSSDTSSAVHGHKKIGPNGSAVLPLENQSSINLPKAVDDSVIRTVTAEIAGEKPSIVHGSSIGFPKQTESKAEDDPAALLSSTAPGGRNLNGSLSVSTPLSSSTLSQSSSTSSSDGAGNPLPPKLIAILEKAIETQPQSLDLSGIHFEGIVACPESIGLLTSLSNLNMSGTEIQILPESVGALTNLVKLELEANQLRELPESLGCLSCLKILNIEKNMIEELPWTIKHCTALEELRADFNLLRGLPEGIGNLSRLRYLSVHLNSLKSLPTTMGNLKALAELDVHFNQLEYLPESICSLTSLRRLDLSSNFTELKALPESIGNLQSLQDLNISYNHLTVLPDSFANLSNLLKLQLDGNPFRDPPLHVTEKGKEAVLEYMKEKVSRKEREKTLKKKGGLFSRLVLSCTGVAKKKFHKDTDVLGLDILA
ncbi:hypothetical protein O6H91_20G070700 [Diphasiastrum complanatum]|uniref:Uncharacterized protein n=1 Tax=Diphasiastrum complanatum TaxID=34168 RepID=A0ACC2ARJ8_DIPCM|nr:hypothetical protein O6H91_20G070700 [Diphasiastrum complanatum]